MVDAYNGLLEENAYLKQENRDNKEYYEIVKLNYKTDIEELERQNKKLLGAKGGYVKEINKLKKQVEELDFKLKESMTGKYVLKKIPSGRKPKSQTMKIKDCSRISNISRKVFGDK